MLSFQKFRLLPTCSEAEVAPIEDEKDEDEKVEEVWKEINCPRSLMRDFYFIVGISEHNRTRRGPMKNMY